MPEEMDDAGTYYCVEDGHKVEDTEIGIIRFSLEPTNGYINIKDFFPQRIILNMRHGPLENGQGYGFECTAGICADYLVKGVILGSPHSVLHVKIKERI